MIPVIICGGVGTKMWPESRQKSPKHFLPLINGKSLFELNYEVLRKKYKAEEIYVSTNAQQAEIAQGLVPEIPKKNYLIEPEKRGTGPAIGFVAAKLFKEHADEPFMIVQSDVLREPEEKFLEMIDLFDELIKKYGGWITGAMKPEYATMGVDYMISGEEIANDKGIKVYKMAKWLWRDSKEKVEEYFNEGLAYIHANHYCATPKAWLESYNRYKPEWGIPLYKIAESVGTAEEEKVVKEQYALMPNEQTETWTAQAISESLIVECPFRWVDFGTWESVDKYLGNQSPENVLEIDSNNNFVRVPSKKLVGLVGVKDLVVIDTPDGLLVCKKDQTGRVGEIVEKLKADGKTELV